MKRFVLFRQKQIALAFLISFLVLSCGIYYFTSIKQPQTAQPGDLLNIPITVRVDSTDGWGAFFAICLPDGWTIPADSVEYSGDYNGAIHFYDGPSDDIYGRVSSPAGYQWWVANGSGPFEADSGNLFFTLPVQSENNPGISYLSYALGYVGGHGAFGIQDFVKDMFIALLDTPVTPPQGGHAYKTVTLDTSYSFKFLDFPFSDSDDHGMIGIRITDIKNGAGLAYDSIAIEENKDYLDVSKLTFNPPQGSVISKYVAFDFQVIDNSNQHSLESYSMTFNIIDGHNDFYVSPSGYDGNPGSMAQPFRSITQALAVIRADSLNSQTIFIANGEYNPETTAEIFPLKIKNHISLMGDSEQGVIIDAAGLGSVMQFNNTRGNIITNMTLRGGDRLYQSRGGGIICNNSILSLENITLTENYANEGGGLNCRGESKLNLLNVTIHDNHANWAGGGIFSHDSTLIELGNVNIYENSASHAGAIYANTSRDSTLKMNNVNILRNRAEWAGAIEAYGFTLVDGMICDNFSNSGSAIRGNNFSFLNVTVANNSSGQEEGCIFMEPSWENPGSFVNLANTIVWGNSPQLIMMGYSEYTASFLNITYSNIQGGQEGIIIENVGKKNWLVGNIEKDPLFTEVSEGNYNLLPASPCIDKGIQDTMLFYNSDRDTLFIPEMAYTGLAPDMGASDAHIGIPYFDIGPVEFKAYRSFGKEEERYPLKITLKNLDTVNTLENITAEIEADHGCVDWIEDSWLEFGDMAPGAEKESEEACYFYLNEGCLNREEIQIAIKVWIRWNNIRMWQDSSRVDDSTFVRIVLDLSEEMEAVPTKYKLSQNYPNPFNPTTTIPYQLPKPSDVNLSVYNILGQKVATLVDKKQTAGTYNVEWDASGFASGIYIYQLTAKGQQQKAVLTKKLVLLK